ncbi:hypothetical protein [Myceligenerans crystallogenes]|uniref:Uncharacterized protein n=1 Tax=Myceligenerans crystallogenes TaxID=316335 RepID=A0ABP4ZGY2_9MICO
MSGDDGAAATGRPADPGPEPAAVAARRNHVPPTRGYVAGVVGAAAVIVLAVTLPVIGLLLAAGRTSAAGAGDGDGLPVVLSGGALAYLSPLLIGLAVGWIVMTSLRRETAVNHPMPRGRALGYGAGWAIITTGAVAAPSTYAVFATPAASAGFMLLLARMLFAPDAREPASPRRPSATAS